MKKYFLLLLILFSIIIVPGVNTQEAIHYRLAVFPGPGKTSIIFTNASYYYIDYDNDYTIIKPGSYMYELVLKNNNETSGLSNSIFRIDLQSIGFSNWDINPCSFAFIDERGNMLNYYISYYNATEMKGIIYVKIPYIGANATLTVYMFCGNGINTANDPDQVFLLCDDFEEFNSSRWRVVKDSVSVINGVLKVSGNTARIQSLTNFSGNIVIKIRAKTDYYAGEYLNLLFYADNESYFTILTNKGHGYALAICGEEIDDDIRFYAFTTGSYTYNMLWRSGELGIRTDHYHDYIIDIENDVIRIYVDGELKKSIIDTRYRSGYILIQSKNDEAKYVDYVYVARDRQSIENMEYISILSYTYLGYFPGSSASIATSNTLYSMMASRMQTSFNLVYRSESGDKLVAGINYYVDTHEFEYVVNWNSYGTTTVGYDNDYFIYVVQKNPTWKFYIKDLYTNEEDSKDTDDTYNDQVNNVEISRGGLFWIVYSPVDGNVAEVFIRAPANYYVDNVTVIYMYNYYQGSPYIYFVGNDCYIKLGYNDNYETYYPFIVEFDLVPGDVPERNTYSASNDPYSSTTTTTTTTPIPTNTTASSGSLISKYQGRYLIFNTTHLVINRRNWVGEWETYVLPTQVIAFKGENITVVTTDTMFNTSYYDIEVNGT
ncbi:MAG: DUF2341 domain-containing protein, partial [Desulfurococcales archaeon]|nr:DUF2341 domain-containing protein [Desulfurococcales archaeon]